MSWSKTYVLVPGNLIFTGIVLFFLLFLGWITLTRIVRPLLRPTPAEARSGQFRNTKPLALGFCLLLIFSPFLGGFLWLWFSPALLTVDDAGEWVVRNGCLFGIRRIPPGRTRVLEADLAHGLDDEGRPWLVYSGELRFGFPDGDGGPGFALEVQAMRADAQEHPLLYRDLGFDRICAPAPGAPGRFLAPPHTFTASGPVPVAAAAKTRPADRE